MLSVVIEAFKKSDMFLCTPSYTFRKSLFDIQRLGFISPCIAHQPDGIHPVQIRLITEVSVKRLRLYMNLLYGAEISCPLFVLERVCITEVFC